MGIHVQYANTANSFSVTVQSATRPYTAPVSGAGTGNAVSDVQPAYVDRVDPLSAEYSLESPDAPLSEAELSQLFKVYINLGKENVLWKDIGNLLSEFTGQDRTNFLSALSRAGDNTKGFVKQVKHLDGDDRSAYLRTAVRLDPDEGLKNLIRSVTYLDEDAVGRFLDVADSLGRSRSSLKAGELGNFMSAAAESSMTIGSLTRKTAELDKENRALFLTAAASAGGDLERLITTADGLADGELHTFLDAASKAGQGLSNLLDLTQDMTTRGRQQMLAFIEGLNLKETTDFLIATHGIEADGKRIMDAASGMSGAERKDFLAIAAGAGDSLDRLITMANLLSPDTGERADFLSAAATAGAKLTDILSLAETLKPGERAEVLSFASGLGLADLSSFITAADGNTDQARDLAETAGELGGKDRSYLLYAAAVAPGNISDLSTLARMLDGGERSDFLFTAANTEDAQALSDLAKMTSELSGSERTEFLAGRRKAYTGNGGESLAREYVFLKSAFSDSEFAALLNAGPDAIEDLVTDIKTMAPRQRELFFSLAEAAGKEHMSNLLAVTASLDDARAGAFSDLASSLDRDGRRDLITAADQALNRSGGGPATFDRLIATVKKLPEGSDRHFLNAAAASGRAMEKLMNLTDLFSGMNRANFLIAAGATADVDDEGRMLKNFLEATDSILEKKLGNILELKKDPEGIRPSQIINRYAGLFRDNAKPGDVNLAFYLESAAFMATEKEADYKLKMTWYNTFMDMPAPS